MAVNRTMNHGLIGRTRTVRLQSRAFKIVVDRFFKGSLTGSIVPLLRIHFSAEDLSRVTLAAEPDVGWEALLSLHALAGRPDHIAFGLWRNQVLEGGLEPSTRLLLALAPPRGYSPDFLTPPTGTDPDEYVDAVMATGRRKLRDQMALLSAQRGSAPWMQPFAQGDVPTLKRLGEAMRRYHGKALFGPWKRIRAVTEAERSARLRDFLEGGVERLLINLHPAIRWEPPLLKVRYPVSQDLRLNGRGLRLIPSYFCWGLPVTLLDENLPPVLVYPANRALHRVTIHVPEPEQAVLSRLLGRTRAAVLDEIATSGGTTGSQISTRLGLSPASASEHAAVLREAGLILSHRAANTVWHYVTPLGRGVLEGHSLSLARTVQHGLPPEGR